MASALLHIKDSYYFEVPKGLWKVEHTHKSEFPNVWVRLDAQFQLWEAERQYDDLIKIKDDLLGPRNEELAEYLEWKHDHANAGRPFDAYLETKYGSWFDDNPSFGLTWKQIKKDAGDLDAFHADAGARWAWSGQKLQAYNQHLSGKIMIPQYFGGELRNLYQKESGFALSKFMVIEVFVALILVAAFAALARQVAQGERPRGRWWNLLETFFVFIRDQVARTAIGEHDAARFVPLLLTIFFFILGCNLFGMLPWMGAPTGELAVTAGMAGVTFGTVVISGMLQFGPIGFVLNQVPSMDVPLWIALPMKPMMLAIELMGLLIKHAVLSVRLLANMVAGHMTLLTIMGLAFSVDAAASWAWPGTAIVVVLGSTLLSILELFVAFLQAYIFTFLSALFIGAAIHHH